MSDARKVNRSCLLTWFTATLRTGYDTKLSINELPPLPTGFDSESVKRLFQAKSTHQPARNSVSPRHSVTSEVTHSEKWLTHLGSPEEKNKLGVGPLLMAILRCYGSSILKVGLLKVLTTGLSFVGPVLLGYIVKYLENGVTSNNIGRGILLVILLAGSSIVSALLNTNYNVRTAVIKINLQGALVRIIFSRCLSLPIIARKELFLTDSQINNLLQVDIDQVSNCFKSIHDLWALPVQIIVACALLYANVKIAFLAGVAVIVIMIPLNSVIAKRIGVATDALMRAKDSRVRVITEALSNVTSLKMAGLEGAVLGASQRHRAQEMRHLSQRKYLDAICVFLWALTPVIVPFVTFFVAVYANVELSAAEVITALALLNMLIFPMNALPWVINGLMEARVSVRRLAKVLSSEDGEKLFVRNRFARKNRHKVKFVDVSFPMDDAGYEGGGGSGEGPEVGAGGDVGAGWSERERLRSIEVRQHLSAERERHLSGEREVRRSELVLHIPSTVWSYVTTHQLKALQQQHGGRSAQNSTDTSSHNPLQLLSAVAEGEDVEAQLRSPLLSQSTPPISGIGGGDLPALPFAVSINEVKLKSGQLLGVVGATGSGKTTLLLGILGEIRGHKRIDSDVSVEEGSWQRDLSVNSSFSLNEQLSGNALQLIRSVVGEGQRSRINVCTGNVAYCPQVPPMHAGTIRENVVMGAAFEEDRYWSVMEGCCLTQDLENGTWDHGDLTEVSSGGSNLSGGQRLRIGVARALYAYSCDLVLLDDPFAALDGSTAQQLSHYLNEVVVKQEKRTVILTTHSVSLLQDADLILVLRQGEEVGRGTADELQAHCEDFQLLLGEQLAETVTTTASAAGAVEGSQQQPRRSSRATSTDSAAGADLPYDQKLEFSATGYLERRVYWTYFTSVGIALTLLIVLSTAVMQALSIGLSFWWAYWATHQDDFSQRDFVLVSSGLVAVALLSGLLRSVLFAKGGLNAARKLYDRLSTAVFHTDIRFFEVTAVGRLTNRFGKDSNTIDDSLPFIMNILLAQTFLLLGSCVVMAVSDPPILLLLVIVAVIYHRMQRFYRKSSRELRRLDSVHRSPVYTVYLECIESAPILRGLGEQCVSYFDRKLQAHLDASLRVALSVEMASQWLGVRLQLLGAVITTILAVTIILNALYHIFPMNAGLAGLSLIYSFTIINNLNGFLNALSETEQEMVSVERVMEYCDLPNEFGEFLHTERTAGHGGGRGTCGSCCGSAACCRAICCCGLCCRLANAADYAAADTKGTYTAVTLRARLDSDDHDYDQSSSNIGSALKSTFYSSTSASVGGNGSSFGQSVGSAAVLYRVLSRNHEGLVLEHVSMTYTPPPQERTSFAPVMSTDCLRDLCITIRPGDRVAIVGRTGSGKSSLLRLLLRLNDYHTGTVRLSGIELRSIPKQRLRSKLSVIPQKPLLFTGTVRFNLDPLGEHSEDDLCAALELCKFAQTLKDSTVSGGTGGAMGWRSEVVPSLERFTDITLRSSSSILAPTAGTSSASASTLALLDYDVTDGGANLSVGQQQLLCLARAVLRRSDLILLDEATAAVDGHTEALLYASLAQYLEATGASMLMVCHKLTSIGKICNKVMTMDDGRIVSYEDCN